MSNIKREIQPDYSAYLEDPKHLEDEIVAWELPKHVAEQQAIANDVLRVCRRFGLKSVLEVGCGIGWLKGLLPEEIRYTGVDANACCIEEARKRHGGNFWVCDVRDLNPVVVYPLVCSFSMLKHFGLHEWLDVASKVLSLGHFAVFTIRLVHGSGSYDEPTEFHNVWIGEDRMAQLLRDTHSHILWKRPIWQEGNKWEGLVVTRRGEVE